jgi:hypothetical protein
MNIAQVDNKLITEHWFRTDVFDIVDEFPNGYIIWSIGRKNFPFECYLPLAKPGQMPHTVDTSDLKAIKVRDERTALALLNISITGNHGKITRDKFEDFILHSNC